MGQIGVFLRLNLAHGPYIWHPCHRAPRWFSQRHLTLFLPQDLPSYLVWETESSWTGAKIPNRVPKSTIDENWMNLLSVTDLKWKQEVKPQSNQPWFTYLVSISHTALQVWGSTCVINCLSLSHGTVFIIIFITFLSETSSGYGFMTQSTNPFKLKHTICSSSKLYFH